MTTNPSPPNSAAPQKKLVKTLKASMELKQIIQWYMLQTKLKTMLHRPMAWGTAAFPIELFWMYDIWPLHPENNACIAGTRKVSQELIEYAESIGFSRDLCSYMKTNIGAYDKKLGLGYGGIPKPTFMAATGTICDTHVKWFQLQARRLNVPLFIFDVPHYVSGSDSDRYNEYLDYVVDQIYDYFDFVKEVTGKKLDKKKFFSVLQKSDRLAELWQEIYEYRKHVPAPLGYADTLGDIFPLVVLPGHDKGIKFFEKLLREIKDRVARNEGVVPEERFRIMFEGIPFWYRIKYFHQLANYGAVVTYEPYTFSFGPRKQLGLNFEESIREMAKLLIQFPYNYNLETRINYFKKTIHDFKIDGVILHQNMSCRPSDAGMIDLKNILQRDMEIPVLLLDADMNDPRAFAEGPMQNRLEGFIEILENNKKSK